MYFYQSLRDQLRMYLIIAMAIILSLLFYFTDRVKEAFLNVRNAKKGYQKITNEAKATITYLIGIPLLILWIAFLVTH